MVKFGTGGWRAIIGEEFIMDNVKILAQSIAEDIKENGWQNDGIVIGYDRRFLSDRAARWSAEVLAGNGIRVYFIERVAPTPLIMFAVKTLKCKYGIAVTASHNPAEYNGIKVFTEGGRDATEVITSRLEAIMRGITRDDILNIVYERGVGNSSIEVIDPFNHYIDSILGMINVDAIREKGLKLLLDPMFGVSRTSLQTILLTTRCDVDIINDRHDTLFGGRLPSPSATTLERLRSTVLERGYDLGIGTDGDADRLGIIDDKGNFIHPNDILVLLYYYLAKYKGWKGGVVRNTATTHLLDRLAEGFGEECYEVPVGFKHISSKMEEMDALIGGESSGGLTIRGHISGKDGIFAASLLVEMICVTGKSISELLTDIYKDYGKLYMTETDYKFSQERKEELIDILFNKKLLPDFGYSVKNISYRDGVKVYFDNDGWIIARFSGTEPLLRIYAEMPGEEESKNICKIMKTFLKL